LTNRDYIPLGLAAIFSPVVLVACLIGGQWGPAAISFIVLIISVTLIFIGAQKRTEKMEKRRPPHA